MRFPAGAPGVARVAIRVRPGASRTVVGGDHDGALVVAVGARAVDGAANAAALRALAAALSVRPKQLRLMLGATGRTKVVEVSEPPADLVEQVEALRRR